MARDFSVHVATSDPNWSARAPAAGPGWPRLAGIELELDPPRAARVFGNAYFNLLRRTADGSLVLSADRWRLHSLTAEAFRFTAQAEQVEPLVVSIDHIQRLAWDRLPRQRVRSQIRLYLTGGDVWTFSGTVDASALPGA